MNEESETTSLGTVISVRLNTEFATLLRNVATQRGCTLSDLLRESAGAVLCAEGLCTCPACPQRKK